MTKYDSGDDCGDNEGNEHGNDDDSAVAGSLSNGTIFDPITTPRSCLGLIEEDQAMPEMALRPWRTIYLRVGLLHYNVRYIHPIKTIVKMYHIYIYLTGLRAPKAHS